MNDDTVARTLSLLFDEREPRWYCSKDTCDGKPHKGCDRPHARTSQRPPPQFARGDAWIWLFMAGRGTGKTRAAAEWIGSQAHKYPKSEWAVIAPTFKDLHDVCIEALMEVFEDDKVQYNRSTLEIILPNGSKIRSYSAEAPERVRGPNLSGFWMDEIAQNRLNYPRTFQQLSLAIRKRGTHVQGVATTTPDGQSKLVRMFVGKKDNSVVVTRGSTYDNRDNLASSFIDRLEKEHKGTRFERQEIFGELLDDVPGALWTAANIEGTRGPQLEPPGGSK